MPSLGWRWLLGLSSVPCFATLAFYGWTIESPRYLCTKGRVKDAYNVLKKVAAVNQTELPLGMLVCDHVSEINEELLSRHRNKFADYKPSFASLLPLFSSRLIRTTLLIWVVYFGNSFLYYGIILLTSELSSDQARCISSISNLNDEYSLYKDTFITSLAGSLELFHLHLILLTFNANTIFVTCLFFPCRASRSCFISCASGQSWSQNVIGAHVRSRLPISLATRYSCAWEFNYSFIIWSSYVLHWNIHCCWHLLPRGKARIPFHLKAVWFFLLSLYLQSSFLCIQPSGIDTVLQLNMQEHHSFYLLICRFIQPL